MNRHNTAILASTILAAVAIMAIAFMIPHTGGDVDEETDIVGHWYLVHYEYYDGEGTGQARNISVDPEISQKDLDIYTVADGMFSGFFMHTNISGTFSNGILDFATLIGDVRYTVHGGVKDGHIEAMLTETIYQDGDVVDATCYAMTYSTTREIVNGSTEQTNISGRWTSFNAMWYNGTATDLGIVNAVVSQSGKLIQVNLRGNDLDLVLEGALSTRSDGTAVGFLISQAGNSWCLTFRNNGVLELGSAMNDFDMFGALTVLMTRDGTAVEEPVVANLQGTTWRNATNKTIDTAGNSLYVANKYCLEFTTQVGNSVMGILHSGTQHYPMIVYLSADSVVRVNYNISYGTGGTIVFSDGWMADGRICAAETRYMQNMVMTSLTTFDKVSDVTNEYDITGHWYVSSFIGYEDNDEYVEYNQIGSKYDYYDLDIYEIRNGLLFGRYLGANVTGSYIGGILTIVCSNHVDGGTAVIDGWVMDENTMKLSEAYTMDRPEGYMYTAYSTILSRDGGASITEEVVVDMVGEWRLQSGYIFNGTTVILDEMSLNIKEYNHNVFYGTMDRVIGNDIVEVGIRGILTSNTTTGEASGMILGSAEGIWQTYLKDGAFTVKLVGERTVGDVTSMATSVCTFVKADDSDRNLTKERTVNLLGTWEASSIATISDTGIWNTEDFRYVIKVEAQNGVSAVGSGHQPGLEGRYALVMTTNVYGNISLVVASDYGLDGVDRGIGWIDESNPDNLRIYIVETYMNVGGHWMTQLTCFERHATVSGAEIA